MTDVRGKVPKTLDTDKVKSQGNETKTSKEPKKIQMGSGYTAGSSYKSVAKAPKKVDLNTMGTSK